MPKRFRASSHVYLRPSGYSFRLTVPEGVHGIVGKHQIRHPLAKVIDLAGRKISGLAARAASQATLVHGTLLVSTDLERIEALCILPPGCPRVARSCDFESRLSVAGVMDPIAGALAEAARAEPVGLRHGAWSRGGFAVRRTRPLLHLGQIVGDPLHLAVAERLCHVRHDDRLLGFGLCGSRC